MLHRTADDAHQRLLHRLRDARAVVEFSKQTVCVNRMPQLHQRTLRTEAEAERHLWRVRFAGCWEAVDAHVAKVEDLEHVVGAARSASRPQLVHPSIPFSEAIHSVIEMVPFLSPRS